MGKIGQWDEYSEWPVHAYLERDKAEEHATKAKRRAEQIHTLFVKKFTDDDEEDEMEDDWEDEDDMPEMKNEYDPGMRMHYNGTSYFIVDIPIQT
jgi:hypothetical protein